MAFGILDTREVTAARPPGTALLTQAEGAAPNTDIILIPEPTQSKHDPLNMSRLRKELYFATLIYGACVTGVVGPLLVPGLSIIATAFEVSLTQVVTSNGALVMALGVSSYACAAFAAVYGRRLVYLSTTLIMVFGCVWGSYATTYRSLLGSRIFQGLGMGTFFSLAGTASINDVFFVHQRGRRAGLWNFGVIVSVNIAPVISGYVITDLGWRWSFRILAIAFGVAFVLVVLFMPETAFDRTVIGAQQHHKQQASNSSLAATSEPPGLNTNGKDEKTCNAHTPQEGSFDSAQGDVLADRDWVDKAPLWRKVLGVERLQIKPLKELIVLLWSPLAMVRNILVLWACIIWSVTFSWVIIQGAVADQIYEAPPYNMTPAMVGILIGVPPLIGSALGTSLGGWLCDIATTFLSARNDGIYEPEFRLLVLIPSFVTTCIGGFGLGLAVHGSLTVWASAVFLGFLNFGVGMGCTAIISYINDVYQDKAADAFGLAMLVKSAFAFGLTFMLNNYYTEHGPEVFFDTWAGLYVGVTLLTVPLYIFGKRIRASIIV